MIFDDPTMPHPYPIGHFCFIKENCIYFTNVGWNIEHQTNKPNIYIIYLKINLVDAV